MSHQQLSPAAPAFRAANASPLPVLTHSRRSALEYLEQAFDESRPLEIVVGEADCGASYLLDRFIAGLTGDVVTARIRHPEANADAGMGELVKALGIDSDGASDPELQAELTSFLAYQRYNKRRTVICFEDTGSSKPVLNNVRRLVELEKKEQYGLMVILSGEPDLNDLLAAPPFNKICAQPGQRIALAPFTPDETQEHIAWELAAAGIADVAQVFEAEAIAAIHDLSEGVPDKVDILSSKCIELADSNGGGVVTKRLVKKANQRVRRSKNKPRSKAPAASVRAVGKSVPASGKGTSLPAARLIARMHGKVVCEQALDAGHVLIGRDTVCDITLANRNVSRHHALVINSSKGPCVLDLGSTNGTYVGGRRVVQRSLKDGDIIAIGDCAIAYQSLPNGKS